MNAIPIGHARRVAARTLLLLILPLLVFAGAAAAQENEPSFEAVFGWNGHMPADRWAPITLHITAADRALSGSIAIEFPQDTFQRATIVAPFAAAAGRTTTTQVIANIPSFCSEVNITLSDERGREITSARYSFDGSPRSRRLTPLMDAGAPVIVNVGSDGQLVGGGIPEAFRLAHGADMVFLDESEPATPPVPQPPARASTERLSWERTAAVSINPSDLPLSAMAWDAVLALVVTADSASEISQTSMAAIHQWVRAGGHLVIIADGPGASWQSWLPQGDRPPFSLDPVERQLVPQVLASVISAARVPEGREKPRPAESIATRPIRLTEDALREGWRLHLQRSADAGPMARGPVGFGHITILGFDPQRTSAVISGYAAAAVWKHILEVPATAWFKRSAAPQSQYNSYVPSPPQQAINTSLDSLAHVPDIGFGIFWIIAAAMVLLGLLVGPIDFYLLRRLGALQRSWLTALVWIALASCIAAAAPRLVRTDPTRISRLTVVDIVQDDSGDAIASTTGLTGIYAGHSAQMHVQEVDPTSWWCGTSVRQPFDSSKGRAPLPMLQQAAGGEHGSLRGNTIRRLPMAQWTFRTFIDRAASPVPLRGAVTQDGDDFTVTVSGLPSGSVVAQALVRTGDHLRRLVPSNGPTGAGEWIARTEGGSLSLPEHIGFVATEHGYYTTTTMNSIGPALMLPGPAQRGDAVESRLATRRWAAVYLRITEYPPAFTVSQGAEHNHSVIARLLIPLAEPLPLPPRQPAQNP